MMVAH